MDYKLGIFEKLVKEFENLPGIGKKSAEKMAFHILDLPAERVKIFAHTIIEASDKIKPCKICSCYSQNEVCDICADKSRNFNIICVVQSMKDVFAIERTNEYNGVYHVLHGLISPMDGIGPHDINIDGLLKRIKKFKVTEVVMATGPTVEGEATATYIFRLLKPLKIKITRLACGIPMGASLEYTDDTTLAIALKSRSEI